MTDAAATQRWPSRVAGAGAIGAGLGLALTAVYTLRRPPCAPYYVRLIDPSLVLLVLLGGLLVAELVVVLVARSAGSHRVGGALGAVLAVAVAVLLVPTVQLVVTLGGSGRFDSGCWTF
jgi:hypothetical protein